MTHFYRYVPLNAYLKPQKVLFSSTQNHFRQCQTYFHFKMDFGLKVSAQQEMFQHSQELQISAR